MTQKDLPFFCICLPVFNGERFIATAVDSILRQTYPDWRLLICDNRSTDDTWEKLQAYATEPRISLLRNSENLGMVGNLNRLLDEAEGHWIGILPADDAYAPHALAKIHHEIAGDERLVLWTHAHRISGDGITPHICAVYPDAREYTALQLAETLYLRGNIFGELSSYFFRHALVRAANLRFSGSSQTTDVRMWIQLLARNRKARARFSPEPLAEVFQHGESISTDHLRTGEAAAELFRFAAEMSGLGWRKAILLRQLFRLLACWVKFRPHLPADAQRLPPRAVFKVGRALVIHSGT